MKKFALLMLLALCVCLAAASESFAIGRRAVVRQRTVVRGGALVGNRGFRQRAFVGAGFNSGFAFRSSAFAPSFGFRSAFAPAFGFHGFVGSPFAFRSAYAVPAFSFVQPAVFVAPPPVIVPAPQLLVPAAPAVVGGFSSSFSFTGGY